MADPHGNGVKTTRTSFRVLEALAERDGAGVTELATVLGLSKSTVHKHLTTLVDLGYLTRTNGTYHVGSRCLDLGAHARKRVRNAARPEVDKLALATGERASVLVETDGMGAYAYSKDGAGGGDEGGSATAENRDTRLVALHSTASGKALLAYLPDERVASVIARHGLSRYTSRTITDREELRSELRAVREQEVALDRGERVRGQRGVAAPVRRRDGVPIAAIELAGPVGRLRGKRLEEDFTGLVLSVATAVETKLRSA